jgi:hypothetical protein
MTSIEIVHGQNLLWSKLPGILVRIVHPKQEKILAWSYDRGAKSVQLVVYATDKRYGIMCRSTCREKEGARCDDTLLTPAAG